VRVYGRFDIKKEADDEVAQLAESAAAAAANHPPRSRRGPTNAERFTSIARENADREVALIEAGALVLQNASAAFKESEKGAPDAAARAIDTLTGIQKDALRSGGISVQRYWINAVCC
jgi:hypothetical protein